MVCKSLNQLLTYTNWETSQGKCGCLVSMDYMESLGLTELTSVHRSLGPCPMGHAPLRSPLSPPPLLHIWSLDSLKIPVRPLKVFGFTAIADTAVT